MYNENFREYLACYTIMNYLRQAHNIIIYEICCCLLFWIILLSSFCNITKVDKTLILTLLSIPAMYNLSIVTFAAFIKGHMYLYINIHSSVKLKFSHNTYVDHKKWTYKNVNYEFKKWIRDRSLPLKASQQGRNHVLASIT